MEHGATRNFQAEKLIEEEEKKIQREREEEELNNPMKVTGMGSDTGQLGTPKREETVAQHVEITQCTIKCLKYDHIMLWDSILEL